MMFGVNFNGTEIPEGYRQKFAARKPLHECPVCGLKGFKTDSTTCCEVMSVRYRPKGETGMAQLQGVATSEAEAYDMHTQASNGTRLVLIERRKTAGADVFGIYCY